MCIFYLYTFRYFYFFRFVYIVHLDHPHSVMGLRLPVNAIAQPLCLQADGCGSISNPNNEFLYFFTDNQKEYF